MGITGTDVAKEAADMVLPDDNFATIVAAVEEGRVIYDNIRKFIQYSSDRQCPRSWRDAARPACSGMPLPLLPLQILWINLVTDGAARAGARRGAPADAGLMSQPPGRRRERVITPCGAASS